MNQHVPKKFEALPTAAQIEMPLTVEGRAAVAEEINTVMRGVASSGEQNVDHAAVVKAWPGQTRLESARFTGEGSARFTGEGSGFAGMATAFVEAAAGAFGAAKSFEDVSEKLEPAKSTKTAAQILRDAAGLLEERGRQYDSPQGERSMPKAVAAFNAITGRELSVEEGWLLMGLVKDVRQYTSGRRHEDSALDGVAYAALEAEEILLKIRGA